MSIYQDYESLDDAENDKLFYKSWKFIIGSIVITPVLLYVFLIAPILSVPPKIPVPILQKYNTVGFELYPDEENSLLKHKDKSYKQRVILIGDVHGCYDQLISLLNEAKYNSDRDEVILLGDFISKGPDSFKVLNLAMKQNFSTILGNHELNILSKYANYGPLVFDDDDVFTINEDPNYDKADSELLIAKKLTPDHVNFLASSPLVLNLGVIPLFNTDPVPNEAPVSPSYKLFSGLATHICILPPYKDELHQNVMDWINTSKYWYEDYNKKMKEFNKNDRKVVYYGHRSSLGLNLQKYTKGLDSGCVNGDSLSGMIISSKLLKSGEITYSQQLIQIDCSN